MSKSFAFMLLVLFLSLSTQSFADEANKELDIKELESLDGEGIDRFSLKFDSNKYLKKHSDYDRDFLEFTPPPVDNSQQVKLSGVPTGALSSAVRRECHPYNLEQKIIASKDLESTLKEHFKICGEDLAKGRRTGLIGNIIFSRTRYDIEDNKKIRRVKFHLPSGFIISGFLGLHPGTQKRPLVIVKCGLFCDGVKDSLWTRISFMHLFDESPFHVLVLANSTGLSSILDNKGLDMGGFHSGQNLVRLARWIKGKSKYAKKISSMHLFGVSLGGHASLYAMVYESLMKKPIFQSVTTFCPVLDLKSALETLYKKNIKGYYYSFKTRLALKETFEFIDILNLIFNRKNLPTIGEWKEFLGSASMKYLQKLDSRDFLPPFKGLELQNLEDFWLVNNFSKMANKFHFDRIPSLIWSSKKDWVIDQFNSGKRLKEILDKERNKTVAFLVTDKVGHCSNQQNYGWGTVSSVLRGMILKHSPNFLASEKKYLKPIRFDLPKYRQGPAKKIKWAAMRGKPFVKLYFFVSKSCSNSRAGLQTKNTCFARRKVTLPFSKLPFAHLLKVPVTKAETQALTRWLNIQIILRNDDGKIPEDYFQASLIQWREYKSSTN